MSDDVTFRDRVDRWRQRARALRAWISFWRSTSWRQRNGLWVCWYSLESEQERAIFKERVLAGIFDAWRAARGKQHVLDPAASATLDDAVVRGSGDFLRDMGYADSDEMRDKFELSNAIALAVEGLGLERAAEAAGLSIDNMRAIADGRVKDVSIGDLRRALVAIQSLGDES